MTATPHNMVRTDHYCRQNDPSHYFQRLQSYSSTGPSFSRPASLAPWSSTRSESRVALHERSDVSSVPASHQHHAPTESAVSHRSESYADSEQYSEKGGKWLPSLRSEYLREHDGSIDGRRPSPKRNRRWFLILVVALVIILTIVIGVVVHVETTAYHYTASTAHVTNEKAFETGGATRKSVSDVDDGVGKGQDVYIYYTGDASNFPSASSWISFKDMWSANLAGIQSSCSDLGYGQDNTAQQTQDIYDAIQNRANASLVDHRFILAVILQESHGCVHVGATTSSGGVTNPGLMQSHKGHSFSSSHQAESIMAMVQDGTQGTSAGAGLVQNLNDYGDPYKAARGYNSGHIPASGDLSAAAGATACYVSDIANRLTGWVTAKSTCPGDTD